VPPLLQDEYDGSYDEGGSHQHDAYESDMYSEQGQYDDDYATEREHVAATIIQCMVSCP